MERAKPSPYTVLHRALSVMLALNDLGSLIEYIQNPQPY